MPTSYRREVLSQLAAHFITPQPVRHRLLRASGVVFEGQALVLSGLRLVGEDTLYVGHGSFINHDCLIDSAAEVRLGRHVALANGVSLITSGHDFTDPRERAGVRQLKPIRVDDGTWIGARAIVLGGVHVGAGAVVGAGSVVTRDVPPHTLWVGSPARQVKVLVSGEVRPFTGSRVE